MQSDQLQPLEPGSIYRTERVLVLKPIDGKKPLSSTGMTDPGLFTGKNSLSAVMDTQTCLWTFKYAQGTKPPVFNRQFTTFGRLLDFARYYYSKRNIKIEEVLG
jgi:hypothetical protein